MGNPATAPNALADHRLREERGGRADGPQDGGEVNTAYYMAEGVV